ncbi:hypothetical protein KVV02_006016 [Mortierella alpina]|uniref:RNA polymerase II-associated protein 3 n=1 Tax=Mortierella alpina TaxID=64518 RepID=A0A9P8A908_MORAP|nr:hypothetical protein KVV02_006016 [Mortierella alpina]
MEFLPLRSAKDIQLQDVRPVDHVRKESLVAVAHSTASEADKVLTKGTPCGTDTTTASLDREAPSRKEYYESWDKFDVDQALDEIEKDKGKPVTTLDSVGSVNTTKTSVSATNMPSGSATASSKPTASQTKVPDPVAAANTEKEKGNEQFKKGQYLKAIEHYSASMVLNPSNPVLPINRAMALLKLERYSEVERDCTLGLTLDSRNVKALWRRGIARRFMGNLDAAVLDFELALKIDPSNKAVKEELSKLRQVGSASKNPTQSVPESKAAPTTGSSLSVAKSPVESSSPARVISSKRVMIKEVQNDRDSELFSTVKISIPPPSVTSSQATTPTVALPTSSPPEASEATKAAPPAAVSPLAPTTPAVYTQATSAKVQMTTPTTTMEFQRDWKSYSRNKDLLYQYIKLIQPEALPSIFKSSFESDYLSSMLAVCREYYIPMEEPQLLYRTLVGLSKVQRFDMTLMFTTSADTKNLVSIFQHLSSRLESCTVYSQAELSALASKFQTTAY